jgi:hypothetical protein
MNVRTFLVTSFGGRVDFNAAESLTAKEVRCIMAVDTNDGFVKMSMETWKRLELFIDILRGVDFTCYEMDVESLLDRYRSIFDAEELQQAAPGTGKGKAARASLCEAGKDSRAKPLPDLRAGVSAEEIAGPPS